MSRLFCCLLVLTFTLTGQAQPSTQQGAHQTDTHTPLTYTGLELAHSLRQRFGLHGSVFLTRTAIKILDSFVDEHQAAFLWKNAIDNLEAETGQLEQAALFGLDAQALAGVILSDNSHGLTPALWQKNLIADTARHAPLEDFLSQHDELDIYLQLPAVWNRLLLSMRQRPHVDWLRVFSPLDSLSPEPTPIQDIWTYLLDWSESPERDTRLADLAWQFNQRQNRLSLMQQSLFKKLVQLTLNKDRQQYLAAALNWLEAFSIIRTYLGDWLPSQTHWVNPLAENNDTWFVAHREQLLHSDYRLPGMLESSFRWLKNDPEISIDSDFHKHLVQMLFYLSDIESYMEQPFRRLLQQQLEVCLNLSEESTPLPDEPIEPRQYTGCVEDLVYWANQQARSNELSGSFQKPENDEALARVLELPAWQLINTLYAMEARDGCLEGAQHRVNPLEWLLASAALTWFNDRWPQYLRTYRPVSFLQQAIDAGEQLQQDFACLKEPVGDILGKRLAQVAAQWQRVKQLTTAVGDEYRQQKLKPGSDIDLLDTFRQTSHYRPESLTIGPCNPRNTCGVNNQLEPSRSLMALFPNHLLLADQLGLGDLRLCYDDVGWSRRETGPTHLSNPAVANYYGHLTLTLKGYFNDKLVFSRRIQSLQKHHYLFARNDPDILALACPLPILGEQIVTQLPEGTHGLVPNRLTFLTAARTSPGAIISHNWIQGEEWRDQLADDLRASELAFHPLDSVKKAVEEKFIEHASAVQKLIYRLLLGVDQGDTPIQKKLAQAARQHHLYRQLAQAMANVFISDRLLSDQQVRGVFYGDQRLPDQNMLVTFYQQQVAIREASNRFESLQQKALAYWMEHGKKASAEQKNFQVFSPVLLKLKGQKHHATVKPPVSRSGLLKQKTDHFSESE